MEPNINTIMPELVKTQQFLDELRVADWEGSEGPMRLSSKLQLGDFSGASLPTNVRLLLTTLEAEGGTKATATGNLNRAFVAKMFEQLEMDNERRDLIRKYSKVMNETEVGDLHLARIVAECGRLLARRSKRFNVTARGRKLMADDQAGAFYKALFIAYFRKFDLTYDFPLRPVPEIQATMAAILWRLDAVAQDWTPLGGLPEVVLLPRVYQRLREAMTHPEFDREEWIFGGHVLTPLLNLGLIEHRASSEWGFKAEDEVRVTRLWRKFIWFDHQV